MKLAQTFQQAINDTANWFEQMGTAHINWNFVDSDCYMECAQDYPTADAFYAEFNALCEIYCRTYNVDSMAQLPQLEVDNIA